MTPLQKDLLSLSLAAENAVAGRMHYRLAFTAEERIMVRVEDSGQGNVWDCLIQHLGSHQ